MCLGLTLICSRVMANWVIPVNAPQRIFATCHGLTEAVIRRGVAGAELPHLAPVVCPTLIACKSVGRASVAIVHVSADDSGVATDGHRPAQAVPLCPRPPHALCEVSGPGR